MGRSEFDYLPPRPAWNAGRKVGAKRPLKPRQIWAIRFHLDREHRLRDRALFDLAIDSKLRGCDLVKIKIGDLVTGGELRTRALVIQQKTGRPVQFEIMSDARGSLLAWLERRGGSIEDYAFPSRVDHSAPMSTRQYARLVDEWVTAVGLRSEDYGTHSLRRTKASIIYKATGNLRAVQILLGHTKIENTVRYLGVDVEDALTLAEGVEVYHENLDTLRANALLIAERPLSLFGRQKLPVRKRPEVLKNRTDPSHGRPLLTTDNPRYSGRRERRWVVIRNGRALIAIRVAPELMT